MKNIQLFLHSSPTMQDYRLSNYLFVFYSQLENTFFAIVFELFLVSIGQVELVALIAKAHLSTPVTTPQVSAVPVLTEFHQTSEEVVKLANCKVCTLIKYNYPLMETSMKLFLSIIFIKSGMFKPLLFFTPAVKASGISDSAHCNLQIHYLWLIYATHCNKSLRSIQQVVCWFKLKVEDVETNESNMQKIFLRCG